MRRARVSAIYRHEPILRPLYHIARYQALGVRKLYSRRLETIARREVQPAGELARDVVYFSSREDLPEQVASIRSLIRYVGQPARIVVVSDGTHSQADRTLLRALSDLLDVVDYGDFAAPDLPGEVRSYARVHPFGKKLGLLMSLPLTRPAMYVDSDVLFFPGAAGAAGREAFLRPGIWYLPDSVNVLDERLLHSPAESAQPINGGLLLYDRPLSWDEALARLPATPSADDFFVEQTVVHLAAHQAHARPLPSALFQLRTDDQFLYRDLTPRRTAAARHYTRTVRNKFWLAISAARP